MNKQITTKEKLLATARRLFWTRGYSNVSVRDITGEAGVDAALVSRYFGGKQGLFEATLADLEPWSALASDPETFLQDAVATFAHAYDPKTDAENAFSMLMSNVNDPEMGDAVRQLFHDGMVGPLTDKLGGDGAQERAAMLMAVLFGAALMRKSFHLDGFADGGSEALHAQIKHLAEAALSYKG